MSARKFQSAKSLNQKYIVSTRQTRLSLPPELVKVHKGGIEFQSAEPFELWKEMTVSLDSPLEGCVNCTGVIVSCAGNRHTGYRVSMAFTDISRKSQARLNLLAYQ